MSYDALTAAEIAVGKPVTNELMTKIKDDLDYLYSGLASVVGPGTEILNGSLEIDADADGVPDLWALHEYPAGTGEFDTATPMHGERAFKFTHPGGAGNGGGYLRSDFLLISELDTVAIRFAIKAPTTIIEDCEDAWNEYLNGNVTSTLETSDVKAGSGAAKLAVAAGAAAGEILATEAITSTDLTGVSHVSVWVKATKNVDAGDLQLLLDDHASCASPLEAVDIPALTANTWARVSIALADPSALTAIISVGIKMVVDLGAFTLYIDDVRQDNKCRNKVTVNYYDVTKSSALSTQDLYSSVETPADWSMVTAMLVPPATARYYKVLLIGGLPDTSSGGVDCKGVTHFDHIRQLDTLIDNKTVDLIDEQSEYDATWSDNGSFTFELPTYADDTVILVTLIAQAKGTGAIRFRSGACVSNAVTLDTIGAYTKYAFQLPLVTAGGTITVYMQLMGDGAGSYGFGKVTDSRITVRTELM
jgi:hypothetical protein